MITTRLKILNCLFMALALTGCELFPGSSSGDAGSAGTTSVEVDCGDDDSTDGDKENKTKQQQSQTKQTNKQKKQTISRK